MGSEPLAPRSPSQSHSIVTHCGLINARSHFTDFFFPSEILPELGSQVRGRLMSCSLILSSRVGGPLCGQTPGLEGPGNRPSPLGGHSPRTPVPQSHSDSLPWDRGVAPSTAPTHNAGLCVPSAAAADPLVHRARPACRSSVGAGLPKSGSRARSLSPVWPPHSWGGRTPLTCPSPGFSEKEGRCLGGAVRPSEARAPHLQEPLIPHPCTPLCSPVPSSHCGHVLLSSCCRGSAGNTHA